MVLTFEQDKELLELKLDHKKQIIRLEEAGAKREHEQRMARLNKLYEIAQAGGIGYIEK